LKLIKCYSLSFNFIVKPNLFHYCKSTLYLLRKHRGDSTIFSCPISFPRVNRSIMKFFILSSTHLRFYWSANSLTRLTSVHLIGRITRRHEIAIFSGVISCGHEISFCFLFFSQSERKSACSLRLLP
jgi:hypothetical protein